MTVLLTATLHVASVLAGYVVEALFGLARLVPGVRDARVEVAHTSSDHTTVLDVVFLALAVVLLVRFLRTGGRQMMAMMGGGPRDAAGHDPADHAPADHAHGAPR